MSPKKGKSEGPQFMEVRAEQKMRKGTGSAQRVVNGPESQIH